MPKDNQNNWLQKLFERRQEQRNRVASHQGTHSATLLRYLLGTNNKNAQEDDSHSEGSGSFSPGGILAEFTELQASGLFSEGELQIIADLSQEVLKRNRESEKRFGAIDTSTHKTTAEHQAMNEHGMSEGLEKHPLLSSPDMDGLSPDLENIPQEEILDQKLNPELRAKLELMLQNKLRHEQKLRQRMNPLGGG